MNLPTRDVIVNSVKTNPRNFGLDAMRAAAITLVFLSHGSKYFPLNWIHGFEDVYWSLGVVGVELFYALSGFLIGGILLDIQKNGASWTHIINFMLRRWMRTLPLYYLVLVCLLVIPWLDPNPRGDVGLYFIFAQNLLSPMQGFWFGPSWSLTIEEWSYMALPFLAFGFFGNHRYCIVGSAAVLILMAILWRFLLTSPVELWDDTARKVVITRLDAIAFGVLLASMQRYLSAATFKLWAKRLSPFCLLVASSTFIICAYRAHDPSYIQSLYGRVFMLPLNGIALAGLLPLVLGWKTPRAFAVPIQLISRLSYAIYLVHWPFLFILNDVPSQLQFLTYLVGTLAVAALFSFTIEQPILRLRPSDHLKN